MKKKNQMNSSEFYVMLNRIIFLSLLIQWIVFFFVIFFHTRKKYQFFFQNFVHTELKYQRSKQKIVSFGDNQNPFDGSISPFKLYINHLKRKKYDYIRSAKFRPS